MKLFQKTYPLIGILLLSNGILLTVSKQGEYKIPRSGYSKASTKEKILKSIERVSKKVFPSNQNLLGKENKDTSSWITLLNRVEAYVNSNAGRDKNLLEAYSLCRIAGVRLVSVLKNIYNSLYSGKRNVTYDSVETSYQNLQKLSALSGDLLRMQRRLEKISYSGKKENVREVLANLNTHIRYIINHLNNDFLFKHKRLVK